MELVSLVNQKDTNPTPTSKQPLGAVLASARARSVEGWLANGNQEDNQSKSLGTS